MGTMTDTGAEQVISRSRFWNDPRSLTEILLSVGVEHTPSPVFQRRALFTIEGNFLGHHDYASALALAECRAA